MIKIRTKPVVYVRLEFPVEERMKIHAFLRENEIYPMRGYGISAPTYYYHFFEPEDAAKIKKWAKTC